MARTRIEIVVAIEDDVSTLRSLSFCSNGPPCPISVGGGGGSA
jgi:hypothetical protein